jgi:hypothetical protein
MTVEGSTSCIADLLLCSQHHDTAPKDMQCGGHTNVLFYSCMNHDIEEGEREVKREKETICLCKLRPASYFLKVISTNILTYMARKGT